LIAAAFLTKGKFELVVRGKFASYNMFSKTQLPPTIYMSQQEKELPIVIDSGTSFYLTPKLDAFLGPVEPFPTSKL
jgi:hypothetical protein